MQQPPPRRRDLAPRRAAASTEARSRDARARTTRPVAQQHNLLIAQQRNANGEPPNDVDEHALAIAYGTREAVKVRGSGGKGARGSLARGLLAHRASSPVTACGSARSPSCSQGCASSELTDAINNHARTQQHGSAKAHLKVNKEDDRARKGRKGRSRPPTSERALVDE